MNFMGYDEIDATVDNAEAIVMAQQEALAPIVDALVSAIGQVLTEQDSVASTVTRQIRSSTTRAINGNGARLQPVIDTIASAAQSAVSSQGEVLAPALGSVLTATTAETAPIYPVDESLSVDPVAAGPECSRALWTITPDALGGLLSNLTQTPLWVHGPKAGCVANEGETVTFPPESFLLPQEGYDIASPNNWRSSRRDRPIAWGVNSATGRYEAARVGSTEAVAFAQVGEPIINNAEALPRPGETLGIMVALRERFWYSGSTPVVPPATPPVSQEPQQQEPQPSPALPALPSLCPQQAPGVANDPCQGSPIAGASVIHVIPLDTGEGVSAHLASGCADRLYESKTAERLPARIILDALASGDIERHLFGEAEPFEVTQWESFPVLNLDSTGLLGRSGSK